MIGRIEQDAAQNRDGIVQRDHCRNLRLRYGRSFEARDHRTDKQEQLYKSFHTSLLAIGDDKRRIV